jgi:hypothetical protein
MEVDIWLVFKFSWIIMKYIKYSLLLIYVIASVEHGVCQFDLSKIDQHSIGIIIDSNTTFLGTGFVLESTSTVITCSHVIEPSGGKASFVPYNSSNIIPIIFNIDRHSEDLAICSLASKIDVKPLLVDTDYNPKLLDTIFYSGLDTELTSKQKDLPFEIIHAKGVITAIGQFTMDGRSPEFIEFSGMGKPGISGGPVFNKSGKVIAVMSQSITVQDGDTTSIINRAVSIKPALKNIAVPRKH